MPKSNVMKDTFGWEVPVESVPLPSKGLLYDPNSTLYHKQTVQISAMTAQEEDIITSQAYMKEGVVIEKLLSSCVLEDNFDPNDLISGDRNALLVSVRITGYGTDYNIEHVCKNCGNQKKHVVNLGELGIKRLEQEPVREGENLFAFELPITKKIVHFKFLTGHDEKEEDIKQKRLKSLGIDRDNSVTNFLERIIVSVDGVTDKNKITHFVNNMPALDSRKLRLHVMATEPGLDMTWKYTCEKCQEENQFNVPVTPEFFWPST